MERDDHNRALVVAPVTALSRLHRTRKANRISAIADRVGWCVKSLLVILLACPDVRFSDEICSVWFFAFSPQADYPARLGARVIALEWQAAGRLYHVADVPMSAY